MNEQQISRSTNENFNSVNIRFEPHREVIESFGYSLRDATGNAR